MGKNIILAAVCIIFGWLSTRAESVNYSFKDTIPDGITVEGVPASIDNGALKLIIDENSQKWTAKMLITVNEDIFANPVMDIRYRIGDPVNAKSNIPVVLKIDDVYTSDGFPGDWRLYPEMDLSKNDWTNLMVDLSPLIESWEGAKGTNHGNIQELTIHFGNNKGPFVASELYIDYIQLGKNLQVVSAEVNPDNQKEIILDLGVPVFGNLAATDFSVIAGASELPLDTVFLRNENFLVVQLKNQVSLPREIEDLVEYTVSYNGNGQIADAGGAELTSFVRSVSVQACIENRWKYWGKYEFSDNAKEAKWIAEDTVIVGWDWSLPEFVEADSLAYFWNKSEPNTAFSCKNLNSVYVQWNELEPVQGEYKFDMLRQRIRDAAVGYDGVTVRLLAAVWKWETFPVPGGYVPNWLAERTNAPRWMDDMDIAKIPMDDEGVVAINMDIMDPQYHELYLKLIKALGESGIPDMPELKIVNVCYRSGSAGEEFTKYDAGNNAVEAQYSAETIEQRTKERLEAWAEAFGNNVRKLMYVGHSIDSYVTYAGELGMGSRQGYIEMYNYTVDAPQFGFTVNATTRYSEVDESNPFITNNPAFGDENEEYTSESKFGWKESFPYRYYVSSFRMLQQRRNYIMHAPNTLNPELTWFLGYALSRKVENTPDAFAMLSEYYLSPWANNGKSGPLKNIERWLYQRDVPGYMTTPAMQVPTAKDLWYADSNKPYDFTARKGKKMGFNVDDRMFPHGVQPMAVKISFYNGVAGKLKLVYKNNEGIQTDSVETGGADDVRTATFFINARMDDTGFDNDFDFIIESEEEVPVFFVRVIKTKENYATKVKNLDWKKQIHAYPNPFSEYLKLSSSDHSEFSYTVFDIMGRKVIDENVVRSAVINTSQWQPGFYFLKASGEKTIKLIKK